MEIFHERNASMSSVSVVTPVCRTRFSVSATCLDVCVQSLHECRYCMYIQFIKKAISIVNTTKNKKLDIFISKVNFKIESCPLYYYKKHDRDRHHSYLQGIVGTKCLFDAFADDILLPLSIESITGY